MLRRFNYTGRKRISQDDVYIRLTGSAPVYGFEAALGNLTNSNYGLPGDARIFVEAYERAAYMRFDFGTVGSISVPPDDQRRLVEFEGSDGVRFRVKVVAAGPDAQLLAEADGILPLAPEEVELKHLPLLPVRSADLGQEIWRIEFPEGLQDRPTLVININAGDRNAVVRSAVFMALAWPALLRQILTRILIVDDEMDVDGDDWHAMWLRFGRSLLATRESPPADEDARSEWIANVVDAFCSKHTLLSRYKESEEETNAIAS